jgi:hypothetical protein
MHQEYRIPSEDLAALNENIVGSIGVKEKFHGSEDC